MADRCDVVVVGGGIMGASATLHLLEAGVPKVRLLERDGLFEATSGAGGGFLGPWTALTPSHGTESKAVPVERYGLDFYAELDAAGYDVDFRQNGILWVAASEAAWEMVQGMAWSAADPGSVEIEPARLAEFTGGTLSAEGVHGTRYLPSGAQVTTVKVGAALADRIGRLGGIVDTRRPVTGIRVRGGRVVGVDTPWGPVDCDAVVMAAGAWTNQLLQPLGIFLPAVPQVTSRITTEPIGIPESLPVLMLQGLMPAEVGGGTVLWIRGHHGGLLWGGMYLTPPRNILVDAVVPDRLDELPTDGVLENQRVARGAAFMPALSQPASVRVKHGAPCYTPDNGPLVGPVPEVEGLYALGGDNELGVTQGPGLGKALADHIAHGSSDLADLDEWRLDRFGGGFPDAAEVFDVVGVSHPHPESWDFTHPDFGANEARLKLKVEAAAARR
jgi:sarcosine oxidase subunit beta